MTSPPMDHAAGDVAGLIDSAATWLRAGRPDAALGPLGEAARLRPGDPALQHDYGLACLECGLAADALAAFERAVALKPRFGDAHLRRGIALEQLGKWEAALAAYRRAARLLASPADSQYRAGALLESLGRNAEAARAFGAAAAAGPHSALGYIAAARARRAEQRDDEAEILLRRAIAADPGNAVAYDLLGNVLAESGSFEAARAAFLQAIACAPDLAGSYYDIVRCRPVQPGDTALLDAMQAALASPSLDPAQRSRVHLALGKAEADLGRHAAAMAHFDLAQGLRDSVSLFDPAAFAARIDRLMRHFTADVFARRTRAAPADTAPIFILGLPRSGTTLVEQILSAHPQVHACGELPFWNERGHDWETAPRKQASDIRAFAAGAAADYLRLLRGLAPRSQRCTDKMPLNFQWAGLIHAALPDAIIIHCRRAPIDTALSIHRTHFNPRMPFPTGGDALVAYIRLYEQLCAHWRKVLPADRFIELQYETMVASPESEIRRIVAACGLVWDESCLHPERNARTVKTPSKWQARQPINTMAQARWRDYAECLGPLQALLD